MTQDPHKFSDADRAFHLGHSIEDSHRPDCRMCGGMAEQTAPVASLVTHDPLCFQSQGKWDGGCQCDLIAKVRADERAKYVLPDLPSGGDHVDYCRDLYCYGCKEIV